MVVKPELISLNTYRHDKRDKERRFSCFYNFIPHPTKPDRYIGAYRYGANDSDDTVSSFEMDTETYVITKEQKHITTGEDPRCFLYQNVPYVLTWSVKPTCNVTWYDIDYKIVNLLDGTVIVLDDRSIQDRFKKPGHPSPPFFNIGKNWMPLVRGDELYFIISFWPLNALKCDIQTGKLTCDNIQPYDVGIHRGGTSMIYHEGLNCFIGLNHNTFQPHSITSDRHTTSMCFVDSNIQSVSFSESIPIDNFSNTGSSITDPLSFFSIDGEMYSCIGWTSGHISKCDDYYNSLYRLTMLPDPTLHYKYSQDGTDT